MRIKIPKIGFEGLTPAKARIIAHLIGDGSHFITGGTNYYLRYEVKDEELLDNFSNDIVSVYGFKTYSSWNPSGFTGELIRAVCLRSKIAFYDMKRYATYYSKDWIIKKELLNSSLKIKKEFLKALYDDEGSVFKEHKRGVIRLYSINEKGLKQVQKILLQFGIGTIMRSGYGARRNVFALITYDLKRFYNKIGFNLTRKQERLKSLL